MSGDLIEDRRSYPWPLSVLIALETSNKPEVPVVPQFSYAFLSGPLHLRSSVVL